MFGYIFLLYMFYFKIFKHNNKLLERIILKQSQNKKTIDNQLKTIANKIKKISLLKGYIQLNKKKKNI